MSKQASHSIHSDTAQPEPFLSSQGISIPADGLWVFLGTETDRKTPCSAVIAMRSGPVQLTRTLNSEEARAVAKMMLEVANEIQAVADKAAADALAKMAGGSA